MKVLFPTFFLKMFSLRFLGSIDVNRLEISVKANQTVIKVLFPTFLIKLFLLKFYVTFVTNKLEIIQQ